MELSEGGSTVLSPREMDVLHLLAQGASNRQIAVSLSISLNTVHTHVKHIQSKLGTTNRTQIAIMVINGAPPAGITHPRPLM